MTLLVAVSCTMYRETCHTLTWAYMDTHATMVKIPCMDHFLRVLSPLAWTDLSSMDGGHQKMYHRVK